MRNDKIDFYNLDRGGGAYTWNENSFKQDRVVKLLNELKMILSSNSDMNILDIGSGTGDFLYLLSSLFPNHHYYGCDLSKSMIHANREKKKNITWNVEDFNMATSYDDFFYDIIIAGEVVEHLYDTDNFFEEVKRILKPGGVLMITTPNLASWLDRLMLLCGMQPFSSEVSNKSRKFGREGFYKLIGTGDTESPSAGHLRCFTKKALRSVASFYGFKISKEISCHVHDFYLNRLITKFLPEMAQNIFFIMKS